MNLNRHFDFLAETGEDCHWPVDREAGGVGFARSDKLHGSDS